MARTPPDTISSGKAGPCNDESATRHGYRVERELPGGGISRLFFATDLSFHREVVVKVPPPKLASEVNAARFQREIAVVAHLQHPHILPILSAGADESHCSGQRAERDRQGIARP